MIIQTGCPDVTKFSGNSRVNLANAGDILREIEREGEREREMTG